MDINEYPHLFIYDLMNMQNYYKFEGVPTFLIRSTTANMFYSLGAALLIISLFFYLIDIKKVDNKFTHMLMYYGKISLSLFLLHYTFILLFIGQFTIVEYPFIIIAYCGFMGFAMYIWNEYGKGIGSPEWIMIQISRIGQKTGETVKKELFKTEEMIKHFSRHMAELLLPEETIHRMDHFIEEKHEKRLAKKKKKEERKKLKKFHKKLGYDIDKD